MYCHCQAQALTWRFPSRTPCAVGWNVILRQGGELMTHRRMTSARRSLGHHPGVLHMHTASIHPICTEARWPRHLPQVTCYIWTLILKQEATKRGLPNTRVSSKHTRVSSHGSRPGCYNTFMSPFVCYNTFMKKGIHNCVATIILLSCPHNEQMECKLTVGSGHDIRMEQQGTDEALGTTSGIWGQLEWPAQWKCVWGLSLWGSRDFPMVVDVAFRCNAAFLGTCVFFPDTGSRGALGKTAWTLVGVRARVQMYVHMEMGNLKQMPNNKESTIGPSVRRSRGESLLDHHHLWKWVHMTKTEGVNHQQAGLQRPLAANTGLHALKYGLL